MCRRPRGGGPGRRGPRWRITSPTAGVGGGLAQGFAQVLLPAPDGPHTTRFSAWPSHSRTRSRCRYAISFPVPLRAGSPPTTVMAAGRVCPWHWGHPALRPPSVTASALRAAMYARGAVHGTGSPRISGPCHRASPASSWGIAGWTDLRGSEPGKRISAGPAAPPTGPGSRPRRDGRMSPTFATAVPSQRDNSRRMVLRARFLTRATSPSGKFRPGWNGRAPLHVPAAAP
jgi:hypothetical protein